MKRFLSEFFWKGLCFNLRKFSKGAGVQGNGNIYKCLKINKRKKNHILGLLEMNDTFIKSLPLSTLTYTNFLHYFFISRFCFTWRNIPLGIFAFTKGRSFGQVESNLGGCCSCYVEQLRFLVILRDANHFSIMWKTKSSFPHKS